VSTAEDRLLPVLSSGIFMVSGPAFGLLIHFELMFMYGVGEVVKPVLDCFIVGSSKELLALP